MSQLRNHVKQIGIDPEEAGIKPGQEKITPRQFSKITEQRRQQELQKLKNRYGKDFSGATEKTTGSNTHLQKIQPHQIRYYSNRPSRKPRERFKDFKQLQEKGIPIESFRDLDPAYQITKNQEKPNPINPYELWNQKANKLIEYAEKEINDKRKDKVEFAEKLLENPQQMDPETGFKWFEEKDTVSFKEINQNILKTDENPGLGKNEKILDQTIDEYWEEIKNNNQINDQEKIKRGVTLDLVKTLQGLGLSKTRDNYLEEVKQFENFFKNFKPETYDNLLENNNSYEIMPVTDIKENFYSSKEVGSCLSHKEYVEAHRMHQNDPFTFVQAIGKNGEIRGYVRSFIMRDEEGRNFLGIDTIEVPKTGGADPENLYEDFENQSDIIKAGALGAINLAEDLNLDYVAGREQRVKYGPRQGFSNTQKTLEYEKLGDTVPYYSVAETVYDEEKKRQIINPENYEGETKEMRRPGFGVYHEPGEQEVRGFQTEPGSYRNSAYILFQNNLPS